MKKIMNLRYLCITIGMLYGFLNASDSDYGMPKKRYLEIKAEYLANKESIREEHAMSSSAFSSVRDSLIEAGVSEQHVEKVIQGYRSAFEIDLDLDARNRCVGGFFINNGFYTWFFTQLLAVMKASYVEFLVDKRFEQKLQSAYLQKFLNNEYYMISENFSEVIVQMSEDEIERVFLILEEICTTQSKIVLAVRRVMPYNLMNEQYYLFKNNVETNLTVLDQMRDFLSEYLGL